MPKGKQGFQKGHKKFSSKGDFKKGHHCSSATEFKKGQHGSPNTEFKKGDKSCFKGKKRPNISEKNHYNWKNGIREGGGYIYILKPSHPFRVASNYVLRSRLVMEKYLGRYLKPEEIVHHINKIRNDDRIENFILFPNKSIHQRFHKNPHSVKPEEIIFDGRKL